MPILRSLPILLKMENNQDKRVEKWIDLLMIKGIRTFEDLASCDRLAELATECQAPFEVFSSWAKWIKDNYSTKTTLLSDEIERVEKGRVFHSFGCQKFDEFLGGIPSGMITQISGDEASGKTQLCHSLAAQASIKKFYVSYVDTESTFSAERIVTMIKTLAPTASVKAVLHTIQVAKIFDVDSLFSFLNNFQVAETLPNSILIIDSMLGVLVPHVIQLGLIKERKNPGEHVEVIREFSKVLKGMVIRNPNLTIIVTIGNLNWFQYSGWSNVPNLKLHLSAEPLNLDNVVPRKIEIRRSFKCDEPKFFNFRIQNSGIKDQETIIQT